MSKKERPISVLIIDDKPDYCDALAGSARTMRIQLQSTSNLEDGIQKLRADKKIEFVILDGRCFVDADQALSNSTFDNIPHRAKTFIDEINREFDREIGYCVNTGFVNDLNKSFEGIFKVFEKSGDSSPLLAHIREYVSNSTYHRLKKKYSKCFQVFDDGLVDTKHEHLLVETLIFVEQSDFKQKNFSPMRNLFEASLLGMINHGLLPLEFKDISHENPRAIQAWCARYLEGKETNDAQKNVHQIPDFIPKSMSSNIRKIKEGLNKYLHPTDEPVSKYEFLSNAFALLEFLVWLPEYQISISAASSHT